MSVGDRSFTKAQGPRDLLPLHVPITTHAALDAQASEMGTSKYALANQLLNVAADEYINSKAKGT